MVATGGHIAQPVRKRARPRDTRAILLPSRAVNDLRCPKCDTVPPVDAGPICVRCGDTLYLDEPVTFPRLPSFAPEHFAVARVKDTGRFKQFRKAISQLDEEGVVQVLRDADLGDQAPILAAVGPMQFDVAQWRLEHEFGAPTELRHTSYSLARRTDAKSAPVLRAMRGVDVLAKSDGTLLALFESPYWLDRVQHDQPELVLEKIVAD